MTIYVHIQTAVDCGGLSTTTFGLSVSYSGTTYNNVATYSCITGYQLIGSSTRTCTSGGSWSGSEPYCQSKSTIFELVLALFTIMSNLPSARPISFRLQWSEHIWFSQCINHRDHLRKHSYLLLLCRIRACGIVHSHLPVKWSLEWISTFLHSYVLVVLMS